MASVNRKTVWNMFDNDNTTPSPTTAKVGEYKKYKDFKPNLIDPKKVSTSNLGDFSYRSRRLYPLSDRDKKWLKLAYPTLQVLTLAMSQIYPLFVLQTFRDCATQAYHFAVGNSKVGPGGSNHQTLPALAIDIMPLSVTSHRSVEGITNNIETLSSFAGAVHMLSIMLFGHGYIRSGYDWDDNQEYHRPKKDRDGNKIEGNFYDGPHHEINRKFRKILAKTDGIRLTNCSGWCDNHPGWKAKSYWRRQPSAIIDRDWDGVSQI